MNALHLAIGIFDGVHRGHRFLIGEALKNARQQGHTTGVFTFYPHPRQVLRLPHAPSLIYPIAHRYWLLKQLGCDRIHVQKFTKAWSQISPERFFTHLTQHFPSLTAIYVGEDFHFGVNRSGDVHTLDQLCTKGGVQLHVLQRLPYQNQPICSTRIRQALRLGPWSDVQAMLSLPYHAIGVLHPSHYFLHRNELIPQAGTYTCRLQNKQGEISVKMTIQDNRFYISEALPEIFYQRPCRLDLLDKL